MKLGEKSKIYVQQSNKRYLPSSEYKIAWLSVESHGATFKVLDEITLTEDEFTYVIFGKKLFLLIKSLNFFQ